MGLDISAQAVDEELLRQRLVPYVLGAGEIDDLIERAVAIQEVAFRANSWGLGLTKVSHDMFSAQLEAAPRRLTRVETPGRKPSLLARLFGAKAPSEMVDLPDPVPGLIGFDTDLSVWGRPFFVVGEDTDEALAIIERYLSFAGGDLAGVDALAREMIARVESRRDAFPPETSEAVKAAARAFGPLPDLVVPDAEQRFDPAQARNAMARQAKAWRTAFAARGSERRFDSETLEEIVDPGGEGKDEDWSISANDVVAGLPLSLMAFHAALHPGWMGRGNNYASFLFEKIGVDCSDLFETPARLFAPLIAEHADLADLMFTTIPENFSLGGYVPPEKVAALVARLEQHRGPLSRAWAPTLAADEVSADYRKLIEPARYALKRGFGYLEGAEIYSGPLGLMN